MHWPNCLAVSHRSSIVLFRGRLLKFSNCFEEEDFRVSVILAWPVESPNGQSRHFTSCCLAVVCWKSHFGRSCRSCLPSCCAKIDSWLQQCRSEFRQKKHNPRIVLPGIAWPDRKARKRRNPAPVLSLTDGAIAFAWLPNLSFEATSSQDVMVALAFPKVSFFQLFFTY